MCAWGTCVHIVFRNSQPQLSLSVLLGVSDGFSFTSYGFCSCVTGVGFGGVRARTRESNYTFVWYCVTVFWPLHYGDGFSNQLCLQVHRFESIPIHVYSMLNVAASRRDWWLMVPGCFWRFPVSSPLLTNWCQTECCDNQSMQDVSSVSHKHSCR